MNAETVLLVTLGVMVAIALIPPVSYLFGKYLAIGITSARNEEGNKKEESHEKES